MWPNAAWGSPPVLPVEPELVPVDEDEFLFSSLALVSVLGRITKPKRSIQVKNLARRVWMIKSLLSRRRSCASGTLEPGSPGTPAVVVGIVGS